MLLFLSNSFLFIDYGSTFGNTQLEFGWCKVGDGLNLWLGYVTRSFGGSEPSLMATSGCGLGFGSSLNVFFPSFCGCDGIWFWSPLMMTTNEEPIVHFKSMNQLWWDLAFLCNFHYFRFKTFIFLFLGAFNTFFCQIWFLLWLGINKDLFSCMSSFTKPLN